MQPLAAAFWGGFTTVAILMLAASVAAAARGFRRVAAIGATYSLVPALFVAAYLGLLGIPEGTPEARFLVHLNVCGALVLTSQLLVVLRGYRKPDSDRRVQLLLFVTGCAVLAASWLLPPRPALRVSYAYAFTLGFWLIGVALGKALRGNRAAWISVAGVALALVNLGAMAGIAAQRAAVPPWLHAVAALSSIAYVTIMGRAMWWRYAYALELRQVLAQGPSYDPVTRLPSHLHAGRLVGAFLRSSANRPLGVIAVTLANVGSLEKLHGRAAYNHALYLSAGRLRRVVPMGAELGRLGEDGFLVLLRTEDPELLKHVAGKVRTALSQPIHFTENVDAPEAAAATDWVAEVGIGITLQRPDVAGSAVATARAMSRAALASPSRIVYARAREAPAEEVPLAREAG